MQRNLAALANQTFDVLVIGGGIHGACVAWEATLRGLSVALVEQADFASGTSANSLKVIHGGLRYLQTADIKRMRQSIKERQTLMRIAPHLVHPLPVLVPTYGHGLKGKEAMTVAMKMNDVISGDRNLPLKDPQKHIPPGQLLSKSACLQQLPDLPQAGLTGAALFYDAQVYNSEQLVLAFIHSAAQRGAQIANYARVIELCKQDGRITGAMIQNQLDDEGSRTASRFAIRAKTVINASGPWIDSLIAKEKGTAAPQKTLAKAMNLVTRPLFGSQQKHAIGITGRAPGSRLFFIAPWRGKSLVGTWYGPNNEKAYPPAATSPEIQAFLAEINQAYPTFNLTPEDVEWVHSGLLPSSGVSAKTGDMKLTKDFQLTDHRTDGIKGLLSVKGVKYTTARDLARKAVDWIFRSQQMSTPPSYSHKTPLHGGDIASFDGLVAEAVSAYGKQVSPEGLRRLVYNYGSAYEAVLQEIEGEFGGDRTPLPANNHTAQNLQVLAAEVKYSLKNTMPQTLSDVVFRRTELGAAGHPGNEAIRLCSDVMGEELGWSLARKTAEVQTVQERFKRHSMQAAVGSQPQDTMAESSIPCAV